MLLGCIGDDFTGSSDLANTLSKQGMRTVLYTGVPDIPAAADVEAGVVALKSRSIDPEDAVRQSLVALEWLQAQGCEQIFFKYCSTFDSTPQGNIGPVADALALALDAYKVIVCPAFPGTGRSIYQGHLFVNDTLLNESGMQNHPLTPMTDPDIRRWLKPQTQFAVGHVNAEAVLAGAASITDALQAEHTAGHRLIVVDALRDADLIEIGAAASGLPLITGGSGVALGLPGNFARRGKIAATKTNWRGEAGKCVVLSGSCSSATRAQVTLHSKTNPFYEIVAADVITGRLSPKTLTQWFIEAKGIPLAYSSADPKVVADVQMQYGREHSAEALEEFFAEVARQLTAAGITKILTAGGETSGAVVEGLGLTNLETGPEIDPGVPALRAGDALVIALKSGNFGSPDYFEKAARVLATDQ
ncbi:MAG: four-carbon acid sugar kinase family protein [Rhodobacteraceae bacterium]|nr:four-carbon acid sugar kinase family protein [Paracoccaceae bacterium]